MKEIIWHPDWLNAEEYGAISWALQESIKGCGNPSQSILMLEEDIQQEIYRILEEKPPTELNGIATPKPSSALEMAKLLIEVFIALSHLSEAHDGYKKEFIVLRLLFIELLNDLQDRAMTSES